MARLLIVITIVTLLTGCGKRDAAVPERVVTLYCATDREIVQDLIGEFTKQTGIWGVALVFQGLALFPHLRALDRVAFAAGGRLTRAKELLARVGLGHRADARLDHLSGGERQRIALARALAQEPRLLLMDEPFASLDDEKRGEMRDLLRSLLDESGTTLVLVTHARDDALDLARRVLVLDNGRPVVRDALDVVLARRRHAAAVRVLGLGQIVAADVTAPGRADTPFGAVRKTAPIGRVCEAVVPR